MKKMIVAVLALSAFSVRGEPDKKTERTWKAKCASCHGASGKADTDQGKKLGIPAYDAAWQKTKTDDQLKEAINNGVKNDKGEMEGYKDKLDAAQVDSLVKHIRNFK